MNIISVNTTEVGGGAESSAVNLSNTFRELGHKSILLVGRKRSSDTHILEIPSHYNTIIRTISELSPTIASILGRSLTIPNRIERLLGLEEFCFPGSHTLLEMVSFKPDVLVFHNLHGKYFDLRSLKSYSRRAPCVLILRDCWLLSGHCAYPKSCQGWKTGCGECPDLSIFPSIKRDATAFNLRRKKNIYDRSILYITAPSQWQIDRAHESILHGRKYRVIPNAIDMNTFTPDDSILARKRLGLPCGPPIILFMAHSQFKDFETMLKAAQQVSISENGKEKQPIFICLGKSHSDHQIQNVQILFPGFIRDPHQLADYYRASNIYLHAAHDETFGKSITEAMACGIPVIATKTGGIPEQITDGLNGILVPSGDFTAISHMVSILLQNPEIMANMGHAAHESVHKYTFINQATSFIEFFKEVIDDWHSFRSDHTG